MKTALIFPGQGAQYVGMGADTAEAFPAAAAIFEKANEIVGYDLAAICFDGPEEKLNSTVHSQPAIFVVSAALLEVFRSSDVGADVKPAVTAGLSLGEYTALYAAGVIGFADCLCLVQKRGQAMQDAAEVSEGGMVSLIGLDEEKAVALCQEAAEGQLLKCANFNCPGQIVVSGTKGACERADKLAEKYGAMKAIPLAVAGAFHTDMMLPAAVALKVALAMSEIKEPGEIKTIANINADYYNSAAQVADGLVKQLVQPILWQKCMEKLMADGVDDFYEIGPGRVLTGLMRRIKRKIPVTNVSCAENLVSTK